MVALGIQHWLVEEHGHQRRVCNPGITTHELVVVIRARGSPVKTRYVCLVVDDHVDML